MLGSILGSPLFRQTTISLSISLLNYVVFSVLKGLHAISTEGAATTDGAGYKGFS